jgi:hypothetical protein
VSFDQKNLYASGTGPLIRASNLCASYRGPEAAVPGRALTTKAAILAPSEADWLIKDLLSDTGVCERHVLATLWEALEDPEQYAVVERGGELLIYKR